MSTPLKTRVLVADDHAVVRRGVRGILGAEPDFDVVGEAEDGADAVAKTRELDPHLVVMDVSMPRMTGLQASRELARHAPDVRVVMLSMHDDEQYFFEALAAGASGYVLKSAVDRELVNACRATMRGEPFIYPAAAAALVRDYLARAVADGEPPGRLLTDREEEVHPHPPEARDARPRRAHRYAIRRGLVQP
jgi:DNA-binding NarL/FixJ family response regulator